MPTPSTISKGTTVTILDSRTTVAGTASIPKPEYPRPDRDRSTRWLTLNGTWDFVSADGATTIIVPFAWESEASGVQRTWLETATYSREIAVPDAWGDARVVLCFGAVHHEASVHLDDVLVGTHVGGSTSFEFDVTEHLAAGTSATLRVEVHAPVDKRAIPHGKQRSVPRDDYDGVSFTPTSGIWQSVWLEARGRTNVASVVLRGDSLTGIDVSGSLAGDAPAGSVVIARLLDDPGIAPLALEAAEDGAFSGRFDLAEPRLWSPADPHLYEIELTVGEGPGADRVIATTGIRRLEARGEQLHLNGERIFLRGVLDQGYWPQSGLTAPSEAALLADLELARSLGFTMVRKHIKLEEPRWLHAADRMGMLVWAEPPAPSRFSPAAADAFEAQLPPMVARDGNHPSIVIWGLYNEEWGLDWDIPGSASRAAAAAHAYDALRAIDDSRPIVENSGWSHVKSDLVDWHYYDEDPAAWAENVAGIAEGTRGDWPVKLGPDYTVDKALAGSPSFSVAGKPNLNSEFGAGFTSLERAWHVRWQTQELRRHDRFAGYVYTELADVEHEMAGLVDADRRRKDWGGLDPADANAETVLIVDLVPRAAGADIEVPTSAIELGVRVSHHGPGALAGHVRATWVDYGTPIGDPSGDPILVTDSVGVEPFRVSDAVLLAVPAPTAAHGVSPAASARLHLWFIDEAGRVRARTFVDAAPIEPPNRRGARQP